MAPARRKGGGRNSAAAAAARRQWKVGDLVLAKLKGFPAWPAMVSEPQKWGVSTDLKKVLVYFFGTKQIAFCNPADVEAFTEEKKNTLLNKRHGKGADFLRAVDEIIDSYEKSKKQDQTDDLYSGDEVAVPNSENSENCPMPIHISKSQIDLTDSSSGNEGPMTPVEALSHNTEIVSKDAFESACALDQLSQTPLTNHFFKKRSKVIPVENGASQKVSTSVRRARNSSRMDYYKDHQVHESNLVSDEFSGYKLGREFHHTSDCPDLDLLAHSAIVSSNACSDNELLKVEMESEAVSVSTNGTLNSSYADGHHGRGGCMETGVVSSSKEDTESAAVVVKKKRKQCRKQAADTVAASTTSEKERGFQNGVNKNIPSSSSVCENFSDRIPNGLNKSISSSSNVSENFIDRIHRLDGDEHLPLVKRARARLGKPDMGKISEDVDKEPVKESVVNHLENGSFSSSIEDANNAHNYDFGSTVGTNSSPSKTCFQFMANNSSLGITRKFSFRDHTLHSESALPPSKRLHRALEAMNVNVAEGAGQDEILKDTELTLGNCRASSGNSMLSALEVQDVHLFNNGDASGMRANKILPIPQEDRSKIFSEATPAEELVKLGSRLDKCCKDKLIGVSKISDAKDCEDPSSDSQIILMDMEANNKEILETNRDSSDFKDSEDPTTGSHTINMNMETNNKEMLEPSCDSCDVVPMVQDDCSKGDRFKSDCQYQESVGRDVNSVSMDNGDKLSGGNEDPLLSNSFEGVKCLRFQSNESHTYSVMHELEKDVTGILISKHSEISPCTTERETSDKVEQSHCPAIVSKNADSKVASDVTSSQPQFHGVVFSEQVSSSCPSSSGTKKHAMDQKEKCFMLGKDEVRFEPQPSHNQNSLEPLGCQGEAFEAAVRSVSRTKESIAHATCLALECAKYGMGDEVVEFLVRNLENESNLHRRIDLFFLVDSVTQCSRGISGDTYSSAVEAVLPRLLSAAAPPGNASRENRRQCLKVLRLWLERRTLPESILRHHMRELESCNDSPRSVYSARGTRTERALNDPLREAEGMLVDEYGSNTSFQLPGFTMPRMLEDDEYRDDEQIFVAVTPERNPGISDAEQLKGPAVAADKHRHILEEVDGELEMEDVAPTCDAGVNIECSSTSFVPPLPEELPPPPPPLPGSPPPAAPSVSPPRHAQQTAIPPPSAEPAGSHLYDNAQSTEPEGSRLYGNAQSMKKHLLRQPNSFGMEAVFGESLPCRASGHVDVPTRAGAALPSRSYGSFRSSNSSMHPLNNNVRKFGLGIPNKPYHIRPPPSTLSNQFSYAHSDSQQQSHSRKISPAFLSQRTNFVPEMRGSDHFSHQSRMNLAEHGIDERCRYSLAAELGQSHHEKAEESYPTFSIRPPPSEPSPDLDYGWPVAHRPLNHRYNAPVSQPPFENSSSRGPHFWRPR